MRSVWQTETDYRGG